jgi:hypothetical protein
MARSGNGRAAPWTARAALALVALFFTLPAGSASAGRLLATGHDADLHCAPNPAADACAFLRAAVAYVRAGAPDITLPVLVVDQPPGQAGAALSNIGVATVVVTPAALPATIDTARYSAVVVASDSSCVGCDLNAVPGMADSLALQAAAPALLRFFNDGGGLLTLAGARNAATYYAFLPLPVGGVPDVASPYTPTAVGATIGLTPAATNCCIAHNSFAPAPSLSVAETDAQGRAETVLADGVVSADPAGAPVLGPSPAAPPGLDHFTCYAVRPTPAAQRTVLLRDQFDTRRVRVRAARELCNPVAKTTGAATANVLTRRAHLTCYGTAQSGPAVGARTVVLRNQFGTQTTRTMRPQTLCVPSLKAIVPARGAGRAPSGPNPERVLDHVRCYGVSPVSTARTVRLRDQFGLTNTKVIRLVRLCSPVQKTFRGVTKKIQRRRAHLACYAIRDATPARPREVLVRNQFERRRLRAIGAQTLCLPTFTQVVAAGTPDPVRPAPIGVMGQFVMKLNAVACANPNVFVHTLTGSVDPAREAGLQTTLSGPAGVTPIVQNARVGADGTFTATAATPNTPGVYRWVAAVSPPDGGLLAGAIELDLSGPAARCP